MVMHNECFFLLTPQPKHAAAHSGPTFFLFPGLKFSAGDDGAPGGEGAGAGLGYAWDSGGPSQGALWCGGELLLVEAGGCRGGAFMQFEKMTLRPKK